MSSVARMLDFIAFKGEKKSEFYKKTKLSNGYLDKVKDLGSDKIESIISSYPEINLEWLVTGKGEMIRGGIEEELVEKVKETARRSGQQMAAEFPDLLRQIAKEGASIPLVSVEAIAGFNSFNFSIAQEDVQSRYVVPDFKEVDFLIPLRGSSMCPKYSAGDIVACRIIRESSFIQWNKTYIIATTEQGILCKRIRKSQKKGCYLAVSDNHEYDPFDIPIKEITGIALIVGVIRLE